MVDVDHPRLSTVRQCEIVQISRSSFYYQPKGESEENFELMRRIDEQFLDTRGTGRGRWHATFVVRATPCVASVFGG